MASKYKEVNPKIVKERVRKLLELSDFLEREYYNKFIGKNLDVLIEEVHDGISIGHTSNYLRIELNESYEKNKIYDVTIL